jgi:hypothetical protein
MPTQWYHLPARLREVERLFPLIEQVNDDQEPEPDLLVAKVASGGGLRALRASLGALCAS